MSTPTPTHLAPPVTPTKSKLKKSKEKEKERERKEKPQLPGERVKIVVRRLPPNLPEDIFWQSVSNWVTDEAVTWKAFFPGKPKKRMNKDNIPSRAYIAFRSPDQLTNFARDYDGHKFVDKAGNESYAVVEYAPYQKVPGEKKKPDSRNATIEKDEDYISFLASLKAASNPEPISIEDLIAAARPPSPPKTTPLLEALKAEKQAQKDKEAIIRNHAHYKELLHSSASGTSRKEEKRKAARAEAPPASSGKKGKKAAAAAPPPAKQIQIQTKPSTSGGSAHNVDPVATPQAAKPHPPGRPGRAAKHVAKAAAKDGNAAPPPIPPSASKDIQPPLVNTSTPTTSVQSPTQDTTPTSSAPARRGRPLLGFGHRQFEAALSGAGVTGERKRKGKESAPGTQTSPVAQTGAQETNTAEKPIPPVSPRRPRHRKEAPAQSTVVNGTTPDASGPSVSAVPVPTQAESGPPSHTGGIRGGRRGRGGGRGRGGPPRIG